MDPLKQYKIAFVGLSLGKHLFSYELGEGFFSCFETSEVNRGQVHIDLVLEKKRDMLVLDFVFSGEVELACDRCLEAYLQPVVANRRLFIKFGEQFEEQTDDILIIPAADTHVDLSHFIYEFIHLSLPIRHVHSDLADGSSGCDPSSIERLNAYMKGGDAAKKEKTQDSRWEALKKLKLN